MKEYCVDLDIAKELEKYDFPMSENVWCFTYTSKAKGRKWFFTFYDEDDKVNPQIPAPCSDELLQQLPIVIYDNYNNDYSLRINQTYDNGEKNVIYWAYESLNNFDDSEILLANKIFNDKKLSNALAKCWLYLKKEDYIK